MTTMSQISKQVDVHDELGNLTSSEKEPLFEKKDIPRTSRSINQFTSKYFPYSLRDRPGDTVYFRGVIVNALDHTPLLDPSGVHFGSITAKVLGPVHIFDIINLRKEIIVTMCNLN